MMPGDSTADEIQVAPPIICSIPRIAPILSAASIPFCRLSTTVCSPTMGRIDRALCSVS